jgi:hypothetical protein
LISAMREPFTGALSSALAAVRAASLSATGSSAAVAGLAVLPGVRLGGAGGSLTAVSTFTAFYLSRNMCGF